MKKRTVPVLFGKKLKRNRWGQFDVRGIEVGEILPPTEDFGTWDVRGIPWSNDREFETIEQAEAYATKAILRLVSKMGIEVKR